VQRERGVEGNKTGCEQVGRVKWERGGGGISMETVRREKGDEQNAEVQRINGRKVRREGGQGKT